MTYREMLEMLQKRNMQLNGNGAKARCDALEAVMLELLTRLRDREALEDIAAAIKGGDQCQ